VNELPDGLKWVGKELQDARSEAARYRTERNEVREQLASAKSPEEFSALQKKVHDLEVTQLRKDAARTHNVPEELLDFLTAEDEAGLEAQAKKLGRPAEKQTIPPTRTAPSGGSQPLGTPGTEVDGRTAYRQWADANRR
jgi:uncharacterized protein (DUF3084 family)